jgi:di/tricarboxylate transporter
LRSPPRALLTRAVARRCARSNVACLDGHSYVAIWIVLVVLVALCNDAPADLTLLLTTLCLSVLPGPCAAGQTANCRMITPEQAWQGFAARPVLTIAALFVFARALQETRAVELLLRPLLGSPGSPAAGLLRLCVPLSAFSAFLSNTAIVAMLLPVVEEWCGAHGLDPAAFLMPLSFQTILGGVVTLIGTSTNVRAPPRARRPRRAARAQCAHRARRGRAVRAVRLL